MAACAQEANPAEEGEADLFFKWLFTGSPAIISLYRNGGLTYPV